MLNQVHIRNYVLIDRLDIQFREGFSVMTGETGAGKSIILGALNLLLGGRADSRTIRQGADKCTIEGTFAIAGYGLEQFFSDNGLDYDPNETIMRRELTASGKSRAFINDTPVTLTQLRDLGCHLIDIHSQHQNLALGTQPFQLDVVDTIAANSKVKTEYVQSFAKWSELKTRLARLKAEFDSDNTDREYLEFQLEGLESARLVSGEQEELEQEADILSHAEEIKQELFTAAQILSGDESGCITKLRSALQYFRSAQKNYPQAQELADRLDSCLIELKDIAETADNAQEEINYDPARLEQVNERLDLIYSLLKKHKKESIAQLLELAGNIRTRLDRSSSYEFEIEQLTIQTESARVEMEKKASGLTQTRKKASDTIIRDIKELQLVKHAGPSGRSCYTQSRSADAPVSERFRKILRETILSISSAENIIVIKTLSGCANAAAEAIDTTNFPDIIGTLAGDNTIFMVVSSKEAVPSLMRAGSW